MQPYHSYENPLTMLCFPHSYWIIWLNVRCGGEIIINHIIFHCPISHELWFTFDHIHNFTIPQPRRTHNWCALLWFISYVHHPYSLNLNYYICIMSGLYGGLFKKHPTTTISLIHIHRSQEFLHVISVSMIPHPLGLVTTHNSISGRMEDVTSRRQTINNSTQ